MRTMDMEIERLRQRAIAAMGSAPVRQPGVPDDMMDALRIVEELRVYQTELEIQNQDLKAAQMQTESAMRRYRRLFENLPMDALTVDGQGFIVEANAAARSHFGLHAKAALQRRSVYQLFAFESRSKLYSVLGHGLEVSSATEVQLMAPRDAPSTEVDAHLITVDPAAIDNDERLMVLVDRTYERRLAVSHREVLRSEARHRALFEDSRVPMLLIDPETGNVVRGNSAAERFYGYADNDLEGMPFTRISGSDPSETLQTMRLANGTEVPVEVHCGPIEIDGRTLLYSIVLDITERILAEQKADAANRLITNLAAQLPGVIYQYQWFPDGRSCFPYASKGIEAVYGVSPEDVRLDATAVFKVIHPGDIDRVYASIAESARSLENWACEYRVETPERGLRWLSGMSKPTRLDDGSVLWHGFVTDITQEHGVRTDLLENERILRASIESVDEAFVLFDPQDRFVYCNERYKTLYATSADLLVPGASFEEILRTGALRGQYPQAHGRIDAWIAERMAAHRSGNTTITQKTDNGRVLRILERRTEDGYTVGFRVDITAISEATEAALTANQHYKSLLDAASEVSIIATDASGVIQVFNRGAERTLGYSAAEVIGRLNVVDFHVEAEVALRGQELACELGTSPHGFGVFVAIPDRDGQEQREWTYVRKNGETIDVALVVTAVKNATNTITGYLGIAQDITQRKQAQANLQLSANVFTWAREGILITDANSRIVQVNVAFSRITGYSEDDAIGQTPSFLKSGTQDAAFYARMWQSLNTMGHWEGEIWNRRKSGDMYPELLSISAVYDSNNKVQNYVALFTDISVQKAHEQELEHIARYDMLTGLPNRALLADRLQQEMAHCLRQRKQLAVVFIDLDGFKLVNDQYGHTIGDEVLIGLAQRMKAALREGDTLARIGGDEFVAVLTALDHPRDCELVLTRLLEAAAQTMVVNGAEIQISASIGVTLFPHDAGEPDLLLRHADHAMYQAKQAGKNRYHYFDVKDDADVKTHRESIDELQSALNRGEFVLHYQPKVNMKTGQVIGMEALIRWQHPTRGLVLPGQFLPTVKGHPLIVQLGEWVVRTAVTQLAAWNALGLKLSVSVNIDALHLQQSRFVPSLVETLAQHPGVHASQLDLEVLETSALDDIDKVTAIMQACCDLGLGFSLDDFGTGYSSLTYLKRLPADLMKIDQSFVIGMLHDSDDFVIVEGVLGLARAFGRGVLAEGVETVAHGELLLALGCELGQGYGIAHAMPPNAVPGWISTWQADASWAAWNQPSDDDTRRDLVVGEIKHRHWLRDIENYVTGKSEVCPALDVQDCPLGMWITAEGRARYGSHEAFAAMMASHDRVHAHARELVEHMIAGDRVAVEGGLAKFIALRDELMVSIRRLAHR